MLYRAAVVGGRGEDWLEGLVYVFERRSKKEKRVGGVKDMVPLSPSVWRDRSQDLKRDHPD